MPQIGDIVRFLNDVGGGRIVRIKDNIAWVDDDGFETPVLLRDCVVVGKAEPEAAPERKRDAVVAPVESAHIDEQKEEMEIEEVEGVDVLNVTLGFEPVERTKLSETDFDASLINDSNYFLCFALLSRDRDSVKWTTRYAGTVEPNTELWLGTFKRSDIALFDHLCLEYIAFKRGKDFELKTPGCAKIKVDTTKFFKLHCFRQNPYFDNDVLAFSLVENDEPAGQKNIQAERLLQLNTVEKYDKAQHKDTKPQPSVKKASITGTNEPLVVDLHIDELVDTTRGMSRADMLNLQVDTFRKVMDENIRNYGKKIIFIHGKGEGVLRHALYKELTHMYRGHDIQDASFAEYGHGATQVTIRQHPDKFVKKRR